MSKKTHQKQLQRARRKRQVEAYVDRKRRRNRTIAIIVVAAMVATFVVSLAASLGGDDEPAIDGFDATDTGEDASQVDPGAVDPNADGAPDFCPPAGDDAPTATDAQYAEPPAMQIDPAKTYTATMVTTCGTIELELFAADAPITVNNFVFLAREGFYDGVPFHRVIDGFMIQGGDPTGTGTGGPGYRFEDELDTVATYGFGRGMLAMANAGPDTNGSQFFIVQGDASHLTTHTVFGRVTSGLDVVDRIALGPEQGGIAVDPVIITELTITEA